MRPCAVLHITSLLGGGVDRHVRDIVRRTSGTHLVWHVGASAEALEIPSERRTTTLDPRRIDEDQAAMARWFRSRSVGIVHAHTLEAKARSRVELVRETLGARVMTTLHDVLFLHPDGFEDGATLEPQAGWLEENARFLRRADAVIAPSPFIARLAGRHIEGLEVNVVPNGSDPPPAIPVVARPRKEFQEHRPTHVVAVVGAIGPHKGSDMLEALALELRESGIAIVVIGYLDRQVMPGWRVPGTYFIHGAYADDELPALLSAYGARLALFPNRAPESFSYTLSDIWACRLPVLVPRSGALGERVAAQCGGWLLDEGFDAKAIAFRLRQLLSPDGSAEFAQVESQLSQPDPARTPALAAMARSLDALYDRFGLDAAHPAESDPAAIEKLVATNLDGSLFREELARLADEYAQLARAHANTVEEARRFETESREWIAKLERDVASLKADLEREVAERRTLGQENVQLAIHKAAFDRLPEPLRKWLLKKVIDARS